MNNSPRPPNSPTPDIRNAFSSNCAFICPVCHISLESASALGYHVIGHNVPSASSTLARASPPSPLSSLRLDLDDLCTDSNPSGHTDISGAVPQAQPDQCLFCHKSFLSAEDLMEHIRMMHSVTSAVDVFCPFCRHPGAADCSYGCTDTQGVLRLHNSCGGRRFATQHDLMLHINNEHREFAESEEIIAASCNGVPLTSNPPQYSCSECGAHFEENTELAHHVENAHISVCPHGEDSVAGCAVCSGRPSILDEPARRTLEANLAFECPHCFSRWSNQQALYRHVRVDHQYINLGLKGAWGSAGGGAMNTGGGAMNADNSRSPERTTDDCTSRASSVEKVKKTVAFDTSDSSANANNTSKGNTGSTRDETVSSVLSEASVTISGQMPVTPEKKFHTAQATTPEQSDIPEGIVSKSFLYDPLSPQCPICGIAFEWRDAVSAHVYKDHRDLCGPPIWECPLCPRSFPSPDHVQVHVSTEHGDGGQTGKIPDGSEAAACNQSAANKDHTGNKCSGQCDNSSVVNGRGKGSGAQAQSSMASRGFLPAPQTIGVSKTPRPSVHGNGLYRLQLNQAKDTELHEAIKTHRMMDTLLMELLTLDSQVWACAGCDHYGSSRRDKGWGCGYRNAQMMLSSLAANPDYRLGILNYVDEMLSISKIQELVELGWRKGIDQAGSQQLGGNLVGRTKWIGATEIWTLLTILGARCTLVDFHCPTGSDGRSHPRMLEWIKDYFKSTTTFLPALYLQHQGHSVTVVGWEETCEGKEHVLVFDPIYQPPGGRYSAGVAHIFRKRLSDFTKRQYQILCVSGLLSPSDASDAKLIRSTRIP